MVNSGLQLLKRGSQIKGSPYKVLIVDDEPHVAEVFRDFCALSDAIDVSMVHEGEEAIRRISADKFDLVTLDLIMPETSGLEILTSIKEIRPQLPVIIVTGNATEKLVNEAGVLGACKVLYKPVQMDDFVAEIVATLMR